MIFLSPIFLSDDEGSEACGENQNADPPVSDFSGKGHPVAKLTGIRQNQPAADRQAWLAKLAELRQRLAIGKSGLTVEQILDEDRGD